ncbi:hypothetical protein [Neoaquamicrobium sediminum]|uniref:hypothetical protein n=1 Tax=Neoaquamicrobium sediminum TaxID=1849104 RepID=UPI003BABF829
MSVRFSGMCIGGPKDGVHGTSDRDVLMVHVDVPAPPLPALDEPMPMDAVVDRVVYRHVAFHFRNSDRPNWKEIRGFWTPEDVRDQHLYVLDRLAAAYRERADG